MVKLLLSNYSYCHIDKVEFFEDDEELYDIDVEDDHSFLLEGGYVVHNSAGGSAKQGRDNKFQAILPLRGKVLNVEKTTMSKALQNKEFQSLVSALNVSPSPSGQIADINDLRFHNVVIMCHTGDTRIPLLNGTTKTIKELADNNSKDGFWVYSVDETSGRAKPGFAYLPRKTGEVTELIEIEFDDGSKTRCTPDHKWIRRNGETVLAKDLVSDDSLMSIDPEIKKITNYNIRVVSVKKITLDKPEPVYNMTVAGTHNYMLENGVVSRNCDADPDGAHIACLLIVFFFKFMRTLIERGHLLVAQPPLYRIKDGKKITYVANDEELDKYVKNNNEKNLEIQRFKGLGEMNPEQLAETVMQPKTRNLLRVTIEDATGCAKTLEQLFGKDVDGRKKFLQKDLDLTTITN